MSAPCETRPDICVPHTSATDRRAISSSPLPRVESFDINRVRWRVPTAAGIRLIVELSRQTSQFSFEAYCLVLPRGRPDLVTAAIVLCNNVYPEKVR
jgi:hypothetical protein